MAIAAAPKDSKVALLNMLNPQTCFQADWVTPDTKIDEKWPEDGRIQFDGYSTQYRPELDLVLKDINCDIRAGEKVCHKNLTN